MIFIEVSVAILLEMQRLHMRRPLVTIGSLNRLMAYKVPKPSEVHDLRNNKTRQNLDSPKISSSQPLREVQIK